MQLELGLACVRQSRLESSIPATSAAWAAGHPPSVIEAAALAELAWLKVQLCYYLGRWAEVQNRAVRYWRPNQASPLPLHPDRSWAGPMSARHPQLA